MSNGNSNNLHTEVTLKRSLTLPFLVVFGLAYLAPTVVFNFYGVITFASRGMMALAYAVAGCAMILTGLSYAKMVAEYPISGSIYTYVQRSFNPYIGFVAGWLMLLDYLLLPMITYLLIGIYVNAFFPIIPVWATVITVVTIGALINCIGVKIAGYINTIVIGAQILFTILFILVMAKYVMGGGGTGAIVSPTSFFNAQEFNISGFMACAAILGASFIGFDAVTTMAEETHDPGKTIGKAIIIICVSAVVVFTLVAYVATIAWPDGYLQMQDPDSGIFELFTATGKDWLGNVFFIVDNCASFICCMAGIAASSRILFSMGRDGVLPKQVFGRLSKRFQTPVNNIVITSVLALTALFYQDNLFGATALVSFGAVSGFAFVNLCVISHFFIRGKRRSPSDLIKYLILPGVGFVVTVSLFIYMENNAKIIGLIWLSIGIIYLAMSTNFFRKPPAIMDLSEAE